MLNRLLLIFIFSICFCSAIELSSISCPEIVSFEKDFICELDFDNVEGAYDVKIQILGDGQTINKIWANSWQRADWYVTRFVDRSDIYNAKLIISKDFDGIANGLVRVRESGTKEYIVEESFEIEVGEQKEIEEDLEDEKDEESVKRIGVVSYKNESVVEKNVEKTVFEVIKINSNSVIETSKKVIKLNADEDLEEVIYESINEKVKRIAFFLFIPFLILAILLLIFKKW